jgi:hypothetical protein
MREGRTTRTVVRALLPWSDVKHEEWLTEQARSGWHLRTVHAWGYTFERGNPEDVAYRVDIAPRCRTDRSEYLGLFRDAGWEHVGTRGLWQIFRKPATGGEVPEIHTDPRSRIVMYQRLAAFLAMMGIALVVQVIPQASRIAAAPDRASYRAVLIIQVALLAVFLYALVRVALTVNRLKKRQRLVG